MKTPLPISGFPEWSPKVQVIEQEYLEALRSVFRKYGFCPLETPAVERLETLIGSGGGENEKQVYGIVPLHAENETKEKDLGLRFDLTIPTARYVAANHHELAFPYARYQMQKVWRGEKAAKARAREFYQCDVDIIARNSLDNSADAIVVSAIYEALSSLNFGEFVIHINNRKFLEGILEAHGVKDKKTEVLTAIDKNDKKSVGEVISLCVEAGMDLDSATKLMTKLSVVNREGMIEAAVNDPSTKEGALELVALRDELIKRGVPENCININPTIARGLAYYTGNVFETRIVGAENFGSISSGGRYENLVGRFSHENFPGVGMSIGLTRLIDILIETGRINLGGQSFADILVLNIDESVKSERLSLINKLRSEGNNVDEYIGNAKFAKQLEYATKKGIRYVAILGGDELSRGVYIKKDLNTGNQEEFKL